MLSAEVGKGGLRDHENTSDNTKAELHNSFIIFLSPLHRSSSKLFLSTVSGHKQMFFLQIQEYFLPILAFIAFSFGEKFGYFASDCRERHFLVPYRPSSLIFRQIYHPSTSFPSKYTIESMVYCSHLPNLVRVTKNKQEGLSQSETAKYFE